MKRFPPPVYHITLPNGTRLPVVRKDIMDAALKRPVEKRSRP